MSRDYDEAALKVLQKLDDPESLRAFEELEGSDREIAARMIWASATTFEDLYQDFCDRADPDLVAALTALAVPRWFDQELEEYILTEHLGFDEARVQTILARTKYCRLRFCHTFDRSGWCFDEEAHAFFIKKAQEDPKGLLDLYRLLARYYAKKLGSEKDLTEYHARNLTLHLAECELHFDLDAALDRLAVLTGRALFAQRIGVPNGIARLLRENKELLGSEARAKWIINHYESLARWANEEGI